ncbi:MAG: SDR family NAD(P)-dependent oxidoreductase [Acidobacteriota bacterium]|nr:SDR family NAD(P)-dependent oxidoreductase [Acidobacteriota bacterium]
MPSKELSDAIAVVTGGGRGIGRAIAAKLSTLDATVIITGRDERRLQQVANELGVNGRRVHAMRCDVADRGSAEEFGERLRRDYGRVNVLVNNAGIGGPGGLFLHQLDPEDWDAIFNTNLRGVYYMLRAVVPLMIATGAGHIINISSLAGKNPLPRGAAYSASKWGLNGLSYGVAEELRDHNIRVSVVCPGSVDTDFSPRRQGKDTSRMLKAEDVAHAVEVLVTQAPQSFMSEILLRPTQKP